MTGPVLRTFVHYLKTRCNRPETTGDIISGTFVEPFVLDKCVELHDPSLNRSHEIPPEAVAGGIFDCFSHITTDWR